MYKILLADDEKVILQGISMSVDWELLNTKLIGTALNGEIALQMIISDPPDIVISDVKMPGMNGLDLIREVQGVFPAIRFILLSGYEEFEFAQTAMEYGVKHYLLKPCSAAKISKVIMELVHEIDENRSKEQMAKQIKDDMQRMIPQAKEQFLRELLTNKTYGLPEWNQYRELYRLRAIENPVRMAIFEVKHSSNVDYELVFALKNIATEIISGEVPVIMDTTIGDRAIILLEDECNIVGDGHIDKIREIYGLFYKLEMYAAVSGEGEVGSLWKLYKQVLELLDASREENGLPDPQPVTYNQTIRQMIQYVQDNLNDESLSLLKLANEVLHMNPDYLSRLFKQETEEKFTSYLIRERVERAKQLLEEAGGCITVMEIAEQVGYGNNPHYFSQVFKKQTGHSLTELKKRGNF